MVRCERLPVLDAPAKRYHPAESRCPGSEYAAVASASTSPRRGTAVLLPLLDYAVPSLPA